MPVITLHDGAQLDFPASVTALEVTKTIGAVLTRKALAAGIDDRLCDLFTVIVQDARIALLYRDPKRSWMLPPSHLLHWAKSYFKGHYLRQLR